METVKRNKWMIVSWVLVIAWAIVIFAMSATTDDEFKHGVGIASMLKDFVAGVVASIVGHEIDPSPIGHFGEYLVFGALLVNALRYHVTPGKAALGTVGITAFYAMTDEFHQMFVPGRMCDPADWVVDVSAAALAALIGWLILRKRKRA